MLILNSQSFSCKEKLLNKILLTQKRNPAFSHLVLDNLLLLFSSPVVSNSLQPHGLQHARTPCPLAIFWSLPKFMSTASVMPSSHLTSDALFSFCTQSFSASGTFPMSWLFTSDWSFSISPSNKYSELISLKVDWFDLFAAQRTLRSLHQHHNLKASILWLLPSLWSSSYNHMWPQGRP